jgi:hypothetical protein
LLGSLCVLSHFFSVVKAKTHVQSHSSFDEVRRFSRKGRKGRRGHGGRQLRKCATSPFYFENQPLMRRPILASNPQVHFSLPWIKELRATNAFQAWNKTTDPVLFDSTFATNSAASLKIVDLIYARPRCATVWEPKHPYDGKADALSDIGLRLAGSSPFRRFCIYLTSSLTVRVVRSQRVSMTSTSTRTLRRRARRSRLPLRQARRPSFGRSKASDQGSLNNSPRFHLLPPTQLD